MTVTSTPRQTAGPTTGSPGWIAWILVVLVGFGATSTVMAWWANDALYDQEIMIAAFGDLPSDPERADEFATWATAEAISGLNVESRLADALPPGLDLVAGRPERVITLAVDEKNDPALALYNRVGFRRVARRIAPLLPDGVRGAYCDSMWSTACVPSATGFPSE